MHGKIDFFKIVDSLGDGVICINDENLIEYINKRATEIIGARRIYCIGSQIDQYFNICTHKEGSIINTIIAEVRSTDNARGLKNDAYLRRPDHVMSYISASISPIDMSGKKYIVISFRDISRIKKLELENLEQKQNLEVIFDQIPIGIMIVDQHLKVHQVNPYILQGFNIENPIHQDKIFGNILKCIYTKDTVCGLSKACENCKIRAKVAELSNHQNVFDSIQVSFTHEENNDTIQRDYQIGFVTITRDKEKLIMLLIQDITERVIYEKKLNDAKNEAERASRLKSEFLSNINHEMRTPLNGIIGMIELAKGDSKNEEVMDYLELAKFSSLNLLEIINNVLDVSKIEAEKFIIHKQLFNLKSMLDEVYAENKRKLNSKLVTFEMNTYKDDTEFFISDSRRIKQLLNNLVDNALKFTERGHVNIIHRLMKHRDDYELLVTIKDTGIGIDERYQENLYENFSQENGSFTRLKGGTGLGLAISKQIIDKLHGSISCESVKGKGTAFTLSIPLEKDENKKNHYHINKKNVHNQKKVKVNQIGKILLVEDDLVNQKVIKKQLELEGHSVDVAVNGKSAIRCFQVNSNYDLILMDIQMPVMNGLEATDFIRKQKFGDDIPIIALTAYALKEEQEEIMMHDFDELLAKPVQLHKLLKMVNDILFTGRKNAELEKNEFDDVFKQLTTMRSLIQSLKESSRINDIESLIEKSEQLYQLIYDSELETSRLAALKIKMDLRKNRFDRIDLLLITITNELDCSIIQ